MLCSALRLYQQTLKKYSSLLNYEHMIYKDVHMMAQCQSGPISTLIQRELSLSSTKYLQNVAKIELVSFSVDMFRSNFGDERLLNL